MCNPEETKTTSAAAVSTDGDYFFEGVEKLFEIWFKPKHGQGQPAGGNGTENDAAFKTLRDIPVEEFTQLTDLVKCEMKPY